MDFAPWITLLTLIVGFIWQAYRENRQRRWDAEDRARLLNTATAALAQGQILVKKADTAVGRADEMMSKTDEIHVATNGKLSAIEQKLAVAQATIESMKEAKIVAKETSDVAVQAALDTPVRP